LITAERKQELNHNSYLRNKDCEDFKQRKRENQKRYYGNHKDWYKEYQKEHQKEYQKKWRASHKPSKSYATPEYYRLWRQKVKEIVLSHYGNGQPVCVICFESRIGCLTIDHINGNGNKHRKELGLGGGHHFYRWLLKQGLPEGYRTLCMNDQFLNKS
jgi:hypothetical protein